MFFQNLFNRNTKLLHLSLLHALDEHLVAHRLQVEPDQVSLLQILTATAQLDGLNQLLPVDLQVLELVLLDETVQRQFQRGRHFVNQVSRVLDVLARGYQVHLLI